MTTIAPSVGDNFGFAKLQFEDRAYYMKSYEVRAARAPLLRAPAPRSAASAGAAPTAPRGEGMRGEAPLPSPLFSSSVVWRPRALRARCV